MRLLIYKKVPDRDIIKLMTNLYDCLSPIQDEIKSAYKSYIIEKGSPLIKPLEISEAQKESLKTAYKSKPKGAGLDWIQGLYINGLKSCPFCGGDGARTIEHYLPKECYPEFSVFSPNLMPSCGTCNQKRNEQNSYGAPIKLFHPYFDKKILPKVKIYTNVSINLGIPTFRIAYEKQNLSEEEMGRIEHHIETSIDEIAFHNKNLSEMSDLYIQAEKYISASDFRKECLEEEEYVCTRTGDLNSWSHMLYKGLLRLSNEELTEIFGDCFGIRAT